MISNNVAFLTSMVSEEHVWPPFLSLEFQNDVQSVA